MNKELSPRPAQKRSLMDYDDYFPFSHQLLYGAQFMIMLKTFGELQLVSWKFVIILWLSGIIGMLIRCARRRHAETAAAEGDYYAKRRCDGN